MVYLAFILEERKSTSFPPLSTNHSSSTKTLAPLPDTHAVQAVIYVKQGSCWAGRTWVFRRAASCCFCVKSAPCAVCWEPCFFGSEWLPVCQHSSNLCHCQLTPVRLKSNAACWTDKISEKACGVFVCTWGSRTKSEGKEGA